VENVSFSPPSKTGEFSETVTDVSFEKEILLPSIGNVVSNPPMKTLTLSQRCDEPLPPQAPLNVVNDIVWYYPGFGESPETWRTDPYGTNPCGGGKVERFIRIESPQYDPVPGSRIKVEYRAQNAVLPNICDGSTPKQPFGGRDLMVFGYGVPRYFIFRIKVTFRPDLCGHFGDWSTNDDRKQEGIPSMWVARCPNEETECNLTAQQYVRYDQGEVADLKIERLVDLGGSCSYIFHSMRPVQRDVSLRVAFRLRKEKNSDPKTFDFGISDASCAEAAKTASAR
jgi:hypothetical protein